MTIKNTKYKYHTPKKSNNNKTIEKRYKILTVFIIILMAILIIKLFYVQVIKNNYYKENLKVLTTKIIEGDSTPRGRIYDRNGVLIVDNKAIKTIYYKKPNNVSTKEEISLAYTLASLIEVDYSRLTLDNLKEFWILNNKKESDKKITDKEWNEYKNRKITNDDISKLKKERVTEEDISIYEDIDKEACYIYFLMNKGYYYTEKVIKNVDVTDTEYAVIAENVDKLKGVDVKLDWDRYYPYGNTFKTILGSVSTSSSGLPYDLKDKYLKMGYSLTDRVGISYIEYQYEEYLKGEKPTYILNNDGTITELSKGRRGNDIVLTIDINLQRAVEEILEEELINTRYEAYTEYFNKSYVVVMDPKTGEILAMAGKYIKNNDDGSFTIYDYTPGVFTASVTPGSIIKGASHVVGYNNDALHIGEVRYDDCIKIAATKEKCSYRSYGYIDDIGALRVSSNVYQFYTAINVGKAQYVYDAPLKIDESAFDTYRDTFAQFGLGTYTEIDLPNESLGYKGTSRMAGLLLDFAIGQYDTYTPIEIAQYMATIANNGSRMQPHILKAVFSSTGEPLEELVYEFEPKELNKVETEDIYLERVKEGFRQVMSPGGTGYWYVDPDYEPAGKTGTAQSFLDTDGDGAIDTATTTANFAGYAPYYDPKVVFAVFSPDVAPEYVPYGYMTNVNTRISQKVSQKYFEIY